MVERLLATGCISQPPACCSELLRCNSPTPLFMCIVMSVATPWIYACNFAKPSSAWTLKSSGMWHHLVEWVVPDVAKGCGAFYVGVQQSLFLDCWTLKIKALWSSETSGNTRLTKQYHINAAPVSEPQLPHHFIYVFIFWGVGVWWWTCCNVLSRLRVIAETFPAAMSIPGNPDEHMTLITTSGKCILLFFYIKWLCMCESNYLSFW
jgi:hypothetical protein